ncbi:SMC-Scp complex subunit ScpB [Congregibacter brevis]|uniref:SMC-Scp complex subunit ScpB n=1 Tax=Congregibacter brevis TaxID=3081201 RepID=A0ABZ0IK62_9GAMM|nr:SMC-Scp complex subunit ScpB [Congregibacter sp. IMCC45268]
MSESTGLVQIIEAALLAAGKPLTVAQLGALFEEHERPTNDDIRAALEEVRERCEGRGFELVDVASGFRFQVREQMSPWVSRLWQERPQKYSRALLETLALVAYRQPITRGEIEEIRGVAVSTNIIRTLHERDWIRVVGHRDVPGRPAMYATTRDFLDYFNLKSLDQLPALADIRDLETLNAELGFSEPLPEAANGESSGNQEESAEENALDSEITGQGESPEADGVAVDVEEAVDTADVGQSVEALDQEVVEAADGSELVDDESELPVTDTREQANHGQG